MHVISRKKLTRFGEEHAEASDPLERWYRMVKKARWATFADIRADFPSADQVGQFTVFNVGGNKFRLVVVVVFERGRVYVRHVLTHREYDTDAWKGDPGPRRLPKRRKDGT